MAISRTPSQSSSSHSSAGSQSTPPLSASARKQLRALSRWLQDASLGPQTTGLGSARSALPFRRLVAEADECTHLQQAHIADALLRIVEHSDAGAVQRALQPTELRQMLSQLAKGSAWALQRPPIDAAAQQQTAAALAGVWPRVLAGPWAAWVPAATRQVAEALLRQTANTAFAPPVSAPKHRVPPADVADGLSSAVQPRRARAASQAASTATHSSSFGLQLRTRHDRRTRPGETRWQLAEARAGASDDVPPLLLDHVYGPGKYHRATKADQLLNKQQYTFTELRGETGTWLKSNALFFGAFGKVSMGRPKGEAHGQKVAIKALRTRNDPLRDPNKPERTRRTPSEVALQEIKQTQRIRGAIEQGVPAIERALWPAQNPLEAVRTGKQASIVYDALHDSRGSTYYMVSTLELGSAHKLAGRGIPMDTLPDLACSMAAQLFVELAAMHEVARSAHLDIKLDNVQYNGFGQFKLADFGMAVDLQQSDRTLVRGLYGTYVAPPMLPDAQGTRRALSTRTDVHLLAAAALQLVAHPSRSPFERVKIARPEAQRFLFDPDRVDEFRQALSDFGQHTPPATPSSGSNEVEQAIAALQREAQALDAASPNAAMAAGFYDAQAAGRIASAAAALAKATRQAVAPALALREAATRVEQAGRRLNAQVRAPEAYDEQAMQNNAALVQQVLRGLSANGQVRLPRLPNGRIDVDALPRCQNEAIDTWFKHVCSRAPQLAEALLPALREDGPAPGARQLAAEVARLLPPANTPRQTRLRAFFERQEEQGVYHDVFADAQKYENRF